jgi:hypothetical protein
MRGGLEVSGVDIYPHLTMGLQLAKSSQGDLLKREFL